jgi:hypothetical protein
MDATFFPMQEGNRYVMKVRMPPGKSGALLPRGLDVGRVRG